MIDKLINFLSLILIKKNAPEISKLLLSRDRNEKIGVFKAKPSIDVFALSLMIFEIMNDNISFYQCLDVGIDIENENSLMNTVANLTDSIVEMTIEKTFPGDIFINLRTNFLKEKLIFFSAS